MYYSMAMITNTYCSDSTSQNESIMSTYIELWTQPIAV